MPTSDWTPNTTDVAARIPTRTADDVGNLKNDFDQETTPTAVQVTRVIESAQRELLSRLPDTLPDDELIENAKDLASLKAAMLVELHYFPRQVGSGESPYRQFKELYDEDLKALVEKIEEMGGGVDEDTGEVVGPTMRPA